MSSGKISICVDALGADDAPSVVLSGVDKALKLDENLEVLLCGPKDVVESFCASRQRCSAIICSEHIEMGEHPAMAVRKKKDSSIVVGSKLVKENKADGFFSAGNTGACLAAATLITGRIKGVERPVLVTNIPSTKADKFTVFCDLGANSDCKAKYLFQFAIMASAYSKLINNVENPSVGLLNIGEEDSKGNQLAIETYKLMSDELSNFAGNAEGKDIMAGKFDVIVTDGFTGNIVLKSMEGTLKTTFKLLKQAMLSSFSSKIGALLIKSNLKKMIKDLNPESIGSALLLGVKGAYCVGHGSSSADAICNGILNAADLARKNIAGQIEQIVTGN